MKLLINQIFENKEAAALPGLLESGGLPALISGLSAVHRANLAAGLRYKTELPLFVICPDDTAAENFSKVLMRLIRPYRWGYTLRTAQPSSEFQSKIQISASLSKIP